MPSKADTKKMGKRHTPLDLFGQIISICRAKQGFAQSELAKKAGINEALYIDIENGVAGVEETAKAIPYIASALRLNPRTVSKVFWTMGF